MTADLRLSGTTVPGTAPKYSKARMWHVSHVSTFWSKVKQANIRRLKPRVMMKIQAFRLLPVHGS